jgi:hypothetical protein
MSQSNQHDTPKPNPIIEIAKKACGIDKLNDQLTDEEIMKIAQWLGRQAPDTTVKCRRSVIGRLGKKAIRLIIATEFPDFYERHRHQL